jgi:hypothetical protein
LTARAAEGISTFETYAGPTTGYTEQVYAYDLLADASGRTQVLLHNSSADLAMGLKFSHSQLPWFIVWKNTAAVEDGYVTGLEPATNLPNFKAFERQSGRVVSLPPGGKWSCQWSIEIHDSKEGVNSALREIAQLQALGKRLIHSSPQAKFSPQ